MRRHIAILSTVLSFLFLAMPVQAHEEGKWVLRGGFGSVQPDDKNLVLDATTFVEVDSGSSLTINATYFFTPKLAFDVLGALPFSHDILLSVDGDKAKIAETKHLPPTFSVQYHFVPEGDFQPYAGVGLNWTTFFSTDTVSDLSNQGIDLDLDDSFGLATQIGADFLVGDDWLINVDVRYIDIETDANLGGADIGGVHIDPWVYSVNFGYRF